MKNNEEKREFDKLKELQKKLKDQSVKKKLCKMNFYLYIKFLKNN